MSTRRPGIVSEMAPRTVDDTVSGAVLGGVPRVSGAADTSRLTNTTAYLTGASITSGRVPTYGDLRTANDEARLVSTLNEPRAREPISDGPREVRIPGRSDPVTAVNLRNDPPGWTAGGPPEQVQLHRQRIAQAVNHQSWWESIVEWLRGLFT